MHPKLVYEHRSFFARMLVSALALDLLDNHHFGVVTTPLKKRQPAVPGPLTDMMFKTKVQISGRTVRTKIELLHRTEPFMLGRLLFVLVGCLRICFWARLWQLRKTLPTDTHWWMWAPGILLKAVLMTRLFLWCGGEPDSTQQFLSNQAAEQSSRSNKSIGKWLDFICAPYFAKGKSKEKTRSDWSVEVWRRYQYILQTYFRMKFINTIPCKHAKCVTASHKGINSTLLHLATAKLLLFETAAKQRRRHQVAELRRLTPHNDVVPFDASHLLKSSKNSKERGMLLDYINGIAPRS